MFSKIVGTNNFCIIAQVVDNFELAFGWLTFDNSNHRGAFCSSQLNFIILNLTVSYDNTSRHKQS